MSQENVEIVRAAFDAWNRGDMDAYAETYDTDAIMRAPEGWPEPGPFVGRVAIMREFEQVRETWDEDPIETFEFVDAADRVVVKYVWRVAGRGPQVARPQTAVFTMRKGKIFGVEFFWDHAEALEAAGLSE